MTSKVSDIFMKKRKQKLFTPPPVTAGNSLAGAQPVTQALVPKAKSPDKTQAKFPGKSRY